MNRANTFAAAAVLSALVAAPVWAAGSKVVQHTRVPLMGSVAESDSTEWISPQAKRTEGTSSVKGGVIGAFAKLGRGNKERITITRLDKGVVWTLDPASKTYTEEPIARFQEGAAEGRRGREAQQPREKSTMRVVDADFSVKVTGEEKTIAGFACKQSIMDGFIEFEDTETKDRSRWALHNEKWATPETASIKHYHAIEREFTRNYMAKLGLSAPDVRTADAMLQGLMRTTGISGAQLAKATAKLASESAKATGFPIVDNFRWTMSTKSAKEGSGTGRSGDESGEQQKGGGLAGLLRGMNRGGSAGSGSLSLEGTTEILSLADENGDFEIPPGYSKVEKD